jgi:lipid-binding SYLF domain-containing protein
MKNWRGLLVMATLLALIAAPSWAEPNRYEAKLTAAEVVIAEAVTRSGAAIPADYIKRARAIAIFPGVVRGGFLYGARYGEGVVLARGDENKWSAPAFFTVTGGSFGLQAGLESADIVLLIMNQKGLQALLKQRFTIGGEISVAAGPNSASAAGDIDIALKADILSYTRSRGLFAGIAVNGARMAFSPRMNREFYSRAVTADDIIIQRTIERPAAASGLLRRLDEY